MSFDIQTNYSMPKNNVAFKSNKAYSINNVPSETIAGFKQMLIDGFPPYLVKREEDKVIKEGTELVDKLGFGIFKDAYLEKLRKTSPKAYADIMRDEIEHKVLSMSNWEMIKFLFKSVFKK